MVIVNGEPKEVEIKKIEVTYPNRKYIAFDGKEFSNKNDCESHELIINQSRADTFQQVYKRSEKTFESDFTGDFYHVLVFNSPEEFISITSLLRQTYSFLNINGKTIRYLNDIKSPKSYPATFLYQENDTGDYIDYNLFDLEEYKAQAREFLKQLEGL